MGETTIEQVLEAVEKGDLTAEEALENEKAGKNRSTLIEQLESMISDEPDLEDETEADEDKEQNEEQEQKKKRKPKKARVKLLKNIKYNTSRYKIGEEIEIDAGDKESFIKAGIIAGE